MTVALDVLQLVGDRLKTITKANGYDFDVATVLIGVDEVSEADRYPLLGVLLESEEAAPTLANCPHSRLTGNLVVYGGIEENENDTARQPLMLMRNIKRALFNAESAAQLSAVLTDFQYAGGDVLPKLDGDARTEVQLRFTARWTENLSTGT